MPRLIKFINDTYVNQVSGIRDSERLFSGNFIFFAVGLYLRFVLLKSNMKFVPVSRVCVQRCRFNPLP